MAPERRPRILLALEPVMLESALGRMLRSADVDDVVELHDAATMPPEGDFDAAITTVVLPPDVHSDVVIVLESTHGESPKEAEVHDAEGRTRHVEVGDATDLVTLLDQVCPPAHRAERLAP